MRKIILSSPLLFPLILILICIFIAFQNYTPGTFLSGWDTLHPEFNFPVNVERLIFGVWRPEQGFGAVSGHSAMADLPRVFILWLFHFFLPLSFLRYSYIFFCLILGPLGVYFLIKQLLKTPLVSFLTALFYLLNLSTVQQFYVPFEMFPTQWAYLPWIILFTLRYLTHHSSKDLKLFSIFTLLATPQAYAAHLWYPFFGAYLLFITLYTILNKTKLSLASNLIVLTLILNSFWLLPNIYYLKTSSWIPKENLQNRLHSQEFLLKNRETGTLANSTLIRGFYFDWNIYNFTDKQFQQLIPEWRSHLKNIDVMAIGYILFSCSLIGLIIAFINKNSQLIPFSPFFVIPFILLSNRVPSFNYLFDLLLKISLLQEVLRFIFTKISILMIFGQVIYFSYFLVIVLKKISVKSVSIILIISLVIYTLPIFQGRLISPLIKIKIPQTYFQLWNNLNELPTGRILALPLHEPAGWTYTSWGYQGSGLSWFGIPQSITDRDSDRWHPVNEQSYREFFTALYQNNPKNLIKTISKYKINYILWDQNIITTQPKNQNTITAKNEIESLLNSLVNQNFIAQIRQYDNIVLYQIISPPSLIEIGTDLVSVGPPYHWHYTDTALNLSNYLTSNTNNSLYFPFRDILTHQNRIDTNKLPIFDTPSGWKIKLILPQNSKYIPPPLDSENLLMATAKLSTLDSSNLNLSLTLPLPQTLTDQLITNFTVPIKLNSTKTSINFNDNFISLESQNVLIPIFTQSPNYLNGQPIDIGFDNIASGPQMTTSIDIPLQSINHTPNDILTQNYGTPNITASIDGKFLTVFTNNITHGININQETLPHQNGYLVGIKSRYTSGLPLRFCYKNMFNGICQIEDELSRHTTPSWDYFLIPPQDQNFGYQLQLNAVSYAQVTSSSDIYQTVILPLPYNYLSEISTGTKPLFSTPNQSAAYHSYLNQSLYYIKVKPKSNQTLILNQSHSKGWLAFYFDNYKIKFLSNHVLVNNWANGWKIPSELSRHSAIAPSVYIFFWPQLLEFAGLLLIPISFLWIVLKKSKDNQESET